VLDPETVKNRGLQIMDVNFVFHCVQPEVVCLADNLPAFYAAA
jgi:hypothetical protein